MGSIWEHAGDITSVAIMTVGLTQVFKQLLSIEHWVVKILLTILVGFVGGILLHFAPVWVSVTVLGISVAVIFYDNILKLLEKISKGMEQ